MIPIYSTTVLYDANMWIVPLSIYLKVNANVCILKIFKSLLGFQEKIQVFCKISNHL